MNIPDRKSFSLQGIYNGHHKVTYRGIPCAKCPFDYVLYQMIIYDMQPDLIIEIGASFGGSALYMADILEITGKGEVHTIDIDERASNAVKKNSRIRLFTNGWQEYDLNLAKGYSKVMVIEDSAHDYKNTLDAMDAFAPLVTQGSYLIIEDGIINALGWEKTYKGGPVKAIDEFLSHHPEFSVDEKLINFFGEGATFNTQGYLKKLL